MRRLSVMFAMLVCGAPALSAQVDADSNDALARSVLKELIEINTADDRAHGQDERITVRHFYQVRELWYRMVKELAGGSAKM